MISAAHFRDEGLGAALRSLDVPDHRPTFFRDLEARLATVKRRRLPPQPRLVAAVAAAAAAVVVAVVVLPRVIGVHGSDVARAAAVKARIAAAIADARSARGELTYTALARDGQRMTTRQRFVFDSSGDQRLTDIVVHTVSAYDGGHGVERAITTSASIASGRFYAERSGLAPGPPDATASTSLLETELGAVVRGLAAAHDPRVRDVAYNGRAAWQLDVALTPNTIYPDVDHLSVTVDRATGWPVHVLATLAGRFRSELRLDRLELDEQLTPGTFSVSFPPDAEVLRSDAGFANVDLQQAATIAGYRPLVPARVPDGFRLVIVAAARAAAPTGPGQANPPSRGVVSLSYRRGLEQIVITTRARGDADWRDPFAVEGIRLHREQAHLAGGALAGSHAEVVVDPRSIPHLWGLTDRLVVTVAGDLSRDQLIAVAEALR